MSLIRAALVVVFLGAAYGGGVVAETETAKPVEEPRASVPPRTQTPAGPVGPAIAERDLDIDLFKMLLDQHMRDMCKEMEMTVRRPYQLMCRNGYQYFQLYETCTLTADPVNPGQMPKCNLVQEKPCERDTLDERTWLRICIPPADFPEDPGGERPSDSGACSNCPEE